jgi:hypothetical protein
VDDTCGGKPRRFFFHGTAPCINARLFFALGDCGTPFWANPHLHALAFGINLDSVLSDVGVLLASGVIKNFRISWNRKQTTAAPTLTEFQKMACFHADTEGVTAIRAAGGQGHDHIAVHCGASAQVASGIGSFCLSAVLKTIDWQSPPCLNVAPTRCSQNCIMPHGTGLSPPPRFILLTSLSTKEKNCSGVLVVPSEVPMELKGGPLLLLLLCFSLFVSCGNFCLSC